MRFISYITRRTQLKTRLSTIPFHVHRTDSDNLAVFVKHKNNGNLAYTFVKKIYGHRQLLKNEIREIVGGAKIIDTKDAFMISGDHKRIIKAEYGLILICAGFFILSTILALCCWIIYGERICYFYSKHVSRDFKSHKS
ncbi:Ribosomal protein L49-IMG2 [Babesia duncani]|uniref:Ribosomal protein L49-IMG2 n=1 Tax=Babesia duncani TaxID=323732 RepID=A0AAD9PGP2_9APIC|nr:Ribosomal protein L49-IMG2 [Babesia duncani]